MTSLDNTGTDTTAMRTFRDFGRPAWKRALLTREVGVLVAVVVVYIIAFNTVPFFSGPTTILFLLLDATPILLIALPMAFVIITGEIDLSVASTLALSSVTLGLLTQAHWPTPAAIVACLVVGLLCGAINGFLVTVVGLPSLAVTIGTLALFRGIAVGLLGTTAITDFPIALQTFVQSKIPGTSIPTVMIGVAILIVVFGALLHFTPFGRGLFALGLSKDAATFSGVNVNRAKFITFLLTGVVAALAGIYWTYRYGSARGDNATGLELSVIAATLLGGVSVFGGKGAIHGVIGGVLLIGVLQSALRLANISSDAINVITGALLVISVLSPRFLAWFASVRSSASRPRK